MEDTSNTVPSTGSDYQSRHLTVDAAFRDVLERHADKTALIFLGEKYTYKKLGRWVAEAAAGLRSLGANQGDRIIIYMPHCPQWVIAWLAVQRVGGEAVPVTHFYGPHELEYIANDSNAKIVLCMDTNFGYIRRIIPSTGIEKVVVTRLGDLLPRWKKLLGKVLDRIPSGRYDEGDGVVGFKSFLSSGDRSVSQATTQLGPQDPVEMLYTGGTTGTPKGVPISNGLFAESVAAQRGNTEALIPRGEDIAIQGAPLYHILGQTVGLGNLLAGDTIILLPRMNLDALMDHVQHYRVKTLFGTPLLFRMILEHDRIDQYNLSSLEHNFSGGDVLPNEVEHRWYERFGRRIYQGYGATETCGGVALTPIGSDYPTGTVGKILSIKDTLLVDPDTLEPVGSGEPGELLVASNYMVTGYWNKPEETEGHFITVEDRLWYKTGDVMRIDEDGWVFFVDRSVDIIKHKGYRVAAAKVESALQEHEQVVGACVVGIPDSKVGERVKAVVVIKEDAQGLTAQDLTRWCRDRLVSYEMPEHIEFRDMLPRSRVGKILRRELRDEERRKLEA